MIRICFVCLGNICRSPTAEGVMLHLLEEEGLASDVSVESAGTSGFHVGEPPDERSVATAKKRGFALPSIAAQFQPDDFHRFDYVLAMDRSNRDRLLRMTDSDADRRKVHLLREFDPHSPTGAEVPDPYYGGRDGFEEVFAICEAACRGLLGHLRSAHGLGR